MSLGIREAWMRALGNVLAHGVESSPRGRPVRELLGAGVTFDASLPLLAHPGRALNYRFAGAEWRWIASGDDRLAPLTRYNSKMAAFSDDGVSLAGAYGRRLEYQWLGILEAIRRDPDTRQAVALIWQRDELYRDPAHPSKDVPCTVAAQFLLRRGRLHSVWTMRSSDLWLGLPYDAFSFARLTSCVAGALGAEAGLVTINAGSQHLYAENIDAAVSCLADFRLAESIPAPSLPGFPPPQLTAASRDVARFPDDLDAPWDLYARALNAPTSKEAETELRGWSA